MNRFLSRRRKWKCSRCGHSDTLGCTLTEIKATWLSAKRTPCGRMIVLPASPSHLTAYCRSNPSLGEHGAGFDLLKDSPQVLPVLLHQPEVSVQRTPVQALLLSDPLGAQSEGFGQIAASQIKPQTAG